jgi:Lipocalin-like domain
MRFAFLILALISQAISTPSAAEEELYGTYALVRTTFKLIDTGLEETISNEKGFITYTREGRMFVVIVRGERPKPESLAKMSDQQRADLFRSMTAYTGKFKFDGKVVEHDIDVSWNEIWTGTKQIRYARREGNRIILTTPQAPRPLDGKISETTLIWEKVN